jgi:hypothetical protein
MVLMKTTCGTTVAALSGSSAVPNASRSPSGDHVGVVKVVGSEYTAAARACFPFGSTTMMSPVSSSRVLLLYAILRPRGDQSGWKPRTELPG